jgi:pyruvate dehydrogenase E2 component (dihydrolipoamide acetyltransferase)
MSEFRMPSLGADMEHGTVVRWLIKPGDQVKRGDIVAEVETQKGVLDVEIFQDGIVSELLVAEGEEADVGAPLAVLNGAREVSVSAESPEESVALKQPVPELEARPVEVHEPPPLTARVSPAARRLARELEVDLTSIQGTGPGGAIGLDDVQRASGQTTVAEPPARQVGDSAAMKKVIAAAMSRSKREIPHYYLGLDIDMTRALDWLKEDNRKRTVTDRILYAALLIKAVSRAVPSVPEVNGFWIDGEFRPSEAVHVGVAISLRDGGLVAPAILDANMKSLSEIMGAMQDLVARARTGKLKASELSDPTITVTNLGDRSVDRVYGVIYPPQVAIVGFGQINERPWNIGGGIGIRPVIHATLSGDHRASVGHRGATFLRHVHDHLMEPGEL